MITYDNRGILLADLFRRSGSVVPRALMVAIPSGILGLAVSLVQKMYIDSDAEEDQIASSSLKSSQLWAAMSAALAFMIFFRTNKAYGRFWNGTTLLHQMWGEWFDAVSCLIAFSHTAKKSKPEEVTNFRHTLVRLMSLCHASALEEIAEMDMAPVGYPCLDVGGLDQTSLKWLQQCKFNQKLDFNRVEVLIHMIQNLIVESQENGAIKIPPPILSRVFQTLSRGQVNLMNCKKIVHTLFPFPYAQVISWLLLAFAIITPFVMSSILEEPYWVFCFSTLPIFGLVSLNYIAVEIEMPFGDDPNDLPLDTFQDHMNNSMLMLISDQADICPHISEFCAKTHDTMKENISTRRPWHFIEAQRLSQGMPATMSHDNSLPVPPPDSIGNRDVVADLQVKAPPQAPQTAPPKAPEVPAATEKPAPQPPPAQEPPAKDPQPAVMTRPPEAISMGLVEPKLNVSALEVTLGEKMEELMRTCDELVANTSALSLQMGLSTEAFKDILRNARQMKAPLGSTANSAWGKQVAGCCAGTTSFTAQPI